MLQIAYLISLKTEELLVTLGKLQKMKSDTISIIQDAKDLFGLEFESIIVGTENKDAYILKSYIDEDKNNRDFICLE